MNTPPPPKKKDDLHWKLWLAPEKTVWIAQCTILILLLRSIAPKSSSVSTSENSTACQQVSVYDTNIALAIYRAEILISLVVVLVRVSFCQILYSLICAGFLGTYRSPARIPSVSVYGGGRHSLWKIKKMKAHSFHIHAHARTHTHAHTRTRKRAPSLSSTHTHTHFSHNYIRVHTYSQGCFAHAEPKKASTHGCWLLVFLFTWVDCACSPWLVVFIYTMLVRIHLH